MSRGGDWVIVCYSRVIWEVFLVVFIVDVEMCLKMFIIFFVGMVGYYEF